MKCSIIIKKVVTYAARHEVECDDIDQADNMAQVLLRDCESNAQERLALAHGLRWQEEGTEFEIFDVCDGEGGGV